MSDFDTDPGSNRRADLEAVAVDYCAGVLSVNAVAHKHGIPESTLRREAKRRGWMRANPEARRHRVALALGGESVANEMANRAVAIAQEQATNQDVDDMNIGLAVARQVVKKLLITVDQVDDPRDLKVIIEANRAAIDTIRKIRSLDAPPPPSVTNAISMTVTDGWDELRAAFDKAIREHGAGHTAACGSSEHSVLD